jgi:tetratricopeptide (TPR) repeat protein
MGAARGAAGNRRAPQETSRPVLRFAVLVPVALAIAVSASTIPGDFVFDDEVVVRDDQRLRDFDLRRIFAENYWGRARSSPNYRPLTLLTFALNYKICGRPWAFHAVNVLLHAAAVAAFFSLARKSGADSLSPVIAASVFAVLPIHVEAVAGIVGRAEMLAAIAAFLAWGLALREDRLRWRAAAPAGLIVLAGMLSKENAAVVVLLAPASALILRKPIPWRTAAASAAAVAMALLAGRLVLGPSPEGAGIALMDNPLAKVDPLTRSLNAIRLLGLYAVRTVAPIHLAGDHSFDQLPVLAIGDPRLILETVAAIAGFVVPAIMLRRKWPAAVLGFAAFPLAFAVTSNIFFPIGTNFAERLAYLPSAGWALVLAGGMGAVACRGRAARRAAIAALGVIVLAYGARSIVRNADWADVAAFDIRLAQDSPRSARARVKAAEGHILLSRRAAAPADRARHLSLAEAEVSESLRIFPDNLSALAARAMLLGEVGRWDEVLRAAVEVERAALREGFPRPAEIDLLRADALFNLDRPAEAVPLIERYLNVRGRSARALFLRGTCRMKAGDAAGALADLDASAVLDPANAKARLNRAVLHATAGRTVEARSDFDAAAALAPDDPQVWVNRGYFFFIQGDVAGALADYRAGIEACTRKGLIVEPRGESVLAFRKRIFDVLLRAGDTAGARREIEAVRTIPSPLAEAAARELEALLPRAPPL